jgi:NAD+ synthase
MIKDIPKLINKITNEIKEFTDIATIGISGGADSTLVAILCMLALGKENVYGIEMPYGDQSIERSSSLIKKLDISGYYCNIGAICTHLAGSTRINNSMPLSTLNYGNMQSRMRMVTLYTINQQLAEKTNKRCRVIGTGNLSEDYIGYDTKGGDALADIFPIGELFKSEVYQLLDFFTTHNLQEVKFSLSGDSGSIVGWGRGKGIIDEEHIDRVPSAGLGISKTDEEELGYSYDEMEPVIRDIIHATNCSNVEYSKYKEMNGRSGILSDIEQFVLDRHYANKHKHEAPKVIEGLREFCD